MRRLPLDDPGTADHRSPGRLLWWMARGQWHTLLIGMGFGIVWMSAQAVLPAVIGLAIDRGVAAQDTRALVGYGALMLLIGLVQAGSGIMRHRFAVTNWLTAAYRTIQLVTRQSVRLGGTLPRRVPTGEVITIGASDIESIGQVMDVSARFSGAIVSFLLVSVILLQTSVPLGLLVLIGVPVLMACVGPLLSPLQRRSAEQRALMGGLSNTASDIVAGLRVLRGIGGEEVFHARYRRESQRTRAAGVRVARLQSILDAAEVLLPGLFVVVVVWLGARYAVEGRISPGELVAFYGYAAFLMIPLRTATEYASKIIRGLVSARRVCRVLALDPDVPETTEPATAPEPGAPLADARTGLSLRPGALTALVSETPEEAARVADRLGLCTAEADPDVTLGGVRLVDLPRAEVRRRVVISDTSAALFSGRLAEVVGARRDASGATSGPDSGTASGTASDHAAQARTAVTRALATASAQDVLDALPDGLDTVVTERGRSFSGGQRQRLVLARALAADPEVLVLVEPTSAVDAHTEARIAARLAEHRAGRTTLVVTSSPLLLDVVDEVAFLRGGTVTARGTHADLLAHHPAYRAVVTRETATEASS